MSGPSVPDPEEIPYFFDNWCSLPWSPWVPFSATKEEFRQIPKEPGLYRIRPVGKNILMYIGETGRTLHRRTNDLRMELRNRDLMPWSDPHAEAAALWAWSDAGDYTYECSATPLDASLSGRRGMKCFLLYRYRQERGRSTFCNFGRFHPRYRKSTTRKEGRRGGKLAEDARDNPAGGISTGPLEARGRPGDSTWMGLDWTPWETLVAENARETPAVAGLFLIADAGSHEIVLIGQSPDVTERLLDHCGDAGNGQTLSFSYHIPERPILPHNLRELEADLIGNYFEQFRKAPALQFRSGR